MGDESFIEKKQPLSIDMNWLEYLISTPDRKPDTTILHKVTEGVLSLLRGQQFRTMDTVLSSFNPEQARPEFSLCLLRVSFTARSLLQEWHALLRKTRIAFARRGLNSKQLLSGLS